MANSKMNLSQTYIYNGKRYGPGSDVEVPDSAKGSLEKKEAEYQEYLKTHEAPAPVTPAEVTGDRHDPRRKPGVTQSRSAASQPSTPQPTAGPQSSFQTDPAARSQPSDATGKGGAASATAPKGATVARADAKDDDDDDARASRGATHPKGHR